MTKNVVLIGLLGISLSGCNIGTSSDALVEEAAQKRWDALIAGNLQNAYSYYSDSYKESVPYEHFVNKVKGIGLWSKAKVAEVKCDNDASKCDVKVKVTVSMRMRGLSKPAETSDIVKEQWKKDGMFSDWQYVSQ